MESVVNISTRVCLLASSTFTALVKSFAGYDENAWSEVDSKAKTGDSESSFAKRLVTGLAAEHYFESARSSLAEFRDCSIENTTRLGCGYDFRLCPTVRGDFLAVEVKGMNERTGNLSLTPKEYEVASDLSNRFFLFVVKNFRESPFHEIYQNPLATRRSLAAHFIVLAAGLKHNLRRRLMF